MCGDEARIGGVVDRAAALVPDLDLRGVAGHARGIEGLEFVDRLARRAQAHEDTHDLVALVFEQGGGDG